MSSKKFENISPAQHTLEDCRNSAPIVYKSESVNSVTLLAGFFVFVVYTQPRVPDTEKMNGYQEEITQKSF